MNEPKLATDRSPEINGERMNTGRRKADHENRFWERYGIFIAAALFATSCLFIGFLLNNMLIVRPMITANQVDHETQRQTVERERLYFRDLVRKKNEEAAKREETIRHLADRLAALGVKVADFGNTSAEAAKAAAEAADKASIPAAVKDQSNEQ